jgi:hypothetical protein
MSQELNIYFKVCILASTENLDLSNHIPENFSTYAEAINWLRLQGEKGKQYAIVEVLSPNNF